jgi:site-specific recombinase XerD
MSAPGKNRTCARGLGIRCYHNFDVQKLDIIVQKMDDYVALLLDSYSARLARQGLAGGTRAKYLAGVAHFICWLGDVEPASATRQDVDSYLDAWHAEAQPSANTIRLRVSALKSFYGYLDDRGLLSAGNAVERIKPPRAHRQPNDRLREDEDRALLAACATDQEQVLVWLLRWTGLRVGEAVALSAGDVDLERRVIRVRSSKTDSGLRTVPIVDERRRAARLAQWLAEPAELAARHAASGDAPRDADEVAVRLASREACCTPRGCTHDGNGTARIGGDPAYAPPNVRLRSHQPAGTAGTYFEDPGPR